MIRGLLATTATLSILTVSAVVGLEAVGVLFQGGQLEPTIASVQMRDDPEARVAALLLLRQEEGDLAQLHRQAEQERREAERQEAGSQAQDEERKAADAHRWAERYRRRHEPEQQLAALTPKREVASLTDAQTERKPPQYKTPEPKLAGPQPHLAIESLGGGVADATRSPARSQPEVCAAICLTKSTDQRPPAAPRLSVRPDRAKSNRATAGGNPACPLLGWLQAAMAQPAPAAAPRTAARRRAT